MSKPVRRCFVISPFGDRGSRKKADQETWRIATEIKKLIDCAAERISQDGEFELQCFRGDEDPKVGVITEAIFRSIYRDHLIIAVLFKTNDNVSYEVGLAHAIARPVITLKHRNYKAPFDVQGHRYIDFSDAALDGDGTERKDVIAELCTQMLDHLPASGAPTFSGNPFDARAVPFGRCIPFDRFRFTYEEWSQLFQDAEQEIWLAGNTLHQLFYSASLSWPSEQASLSTVLTTLLLDGRDVNILIMDEANLALNWRLLRFRKNQPEDATDQRLEGLHSKVLGTEKLVHGVIKAAAETNPNPGRSRGTLKFTKVQHGLVKHRVTMSEKRAFITPIFYSLAVNSGPSFDVYPKSAKELVGGDEYSKISLYKVVRDDLSLLQQTNPTLSMLPDGTVIDGLKTSEPTQATRRSI